MAKKVGRKPIVCMYYGGESHTYKYCLRKEKDKRKQYNNKAEQGDKKEEEGKMELKKIGFWQLTPRSKKNEQWAILK